LDYYQIINDAFQMNYGISILRIGSGLDFTELLLNDYFIPLIDENNENDDLDSTSSDNQDITIKESFIELNSTKTDLKLGLEKMISNQNETNLRSTDNNNNKQQQETIPLNELNCKQIKNSLCNNHVIKLNQQNSKIKVLQGLNLFHKKYHNGFIDVYWLFDDGGLTILLPYLLMQRKFWAKCKLRIFIQSKNEEVTGISEEQRTMATLLSKFRIKFHALKVFSTFKRKPEPDTYIFNNIKIHSIKIYLIFFFFKVLFILTN